ncbi:hypothetical protein CVT25_002704 [Psilocybe cyanescens]|uniref:Uncharacterized protein n=1 Tax=Psilocybe cyanescens TaxID=93625 RepID=A0A409WLK1_PSICY|nr:hypothetical protein CVT25_002704 [Psilocybe cyanescens]
MAPKNKKPKVEATVPKPAAFTLDLAREGALEIASNSEKGILAMPVELRTEILDNFLKITLFTETTHDDPVLPEKYLARTDALRALSQVCVAYRREFLPFLWEKLNICCDARDSAVDVSVLFHINIGKALERKCDGLIVSPHLQPYIRSAAFCELTII